MILMLPCMYAPLSPSQARLQVLRTKTHGPKFEEAGDDLDIDGELEDDWGVVDEEEAWGLGPWALARTRAEPGLGLCWVSVSGAWSLEAADDPLLEEYMQKMGYSPLDDQSEVPSRKE